MGTLRSGSGDFGKSRWSGCLATCGATRVATQGSADHWGYAIQLAHFLPDQSDVFECTEQEQHIPTCYGSALGITGLRLICTKLFLECHLDLRQLHFTSFLIHRFRGDLPKG